MNTFENFAVDTLAETGFHTMPLAQIMQQAEMTISSDALYRYHTARRVTDETHTLVYDINPYGVRADTPSMVVRRAAMAQVLGKGYALFGLEVSNPADLPLRNQDAKLVSSGSFEPYAYRTLEAMSHIRGRYGNPAAQAEQVLYGFSMGADVAAEASNMIITDESAGIMALHGLGVFDPARTGKRSRMKMVQDFSASGPDLFDEIIASKTDSLNESRGIKSDSVSERRRFNRREAIHVGALALRHPGESLSVMSGFGTDMTTRNLVEITRSGRVKSVVGRMSESTVCHDALLSSLRREQTVSQMDPELETFGSYEHADKATRLYEYRDYTHAAADNLHKSAGFLLQTVLR